MPARPFSTAPGAASWRKTRRPDAAITWAIPPPIWPAPTTRTRSRFTAEDTTGTRARVDGVLRVMVRTLFLTFGAWLTLAACGGTDEAATPPQAPAAAKPAPSDSVLAAWSDASGSELFWANGAHARAGERSFLPRSPSSTAPPSTRPTGRCSRSAAARPPSSTSSISSGCARWGRSSSPRGRRSTGSTGRRPTASSPASGASGRRSAALQPGARKPIAVHDLDGMILKSSPAGDGLAILLAPDRRDRPGEARALRRRRGAMRRPARRQSRLGRVRRAGGLPRPPARAGPRGRPLGSRAVVIAPGNRAVEVDLASMTTSSHDLVQAGLTPRALPQLARAGRLGEDDRRPGAERRLAPDRPDRAERRHLHDRRRLGSRDAGGPCARRPRQLERAPRQRRAGLGDAPRRRPAGLCLGRGLGRARRCTSSTRRDACGSSSSAKGGPISRRSPASTSTSATQDGLRYEIVDLATGETVGRASPERPAYILLTE